MRHLSQAVLGAALFTAPAWAESPSARQAFGPGEQSTFEVRYLGVPTGVAVITVGLPMEQFGKSVWPLVATAQTDLPVYPVRDRFVSYWDYATGTAVGSEFHQDENKKRHREKFHYDRQQRRITGVKQAGGRPEVPCSYDATEGVVDLAAAAFTVRNRALKLDEELALPIFTGRLTYQMNAKVIGKEKLATPMGEKDCLKVTFTADWRGMLTPTRPLTLWFTDDALHLPVRFEAELLLGTVVAELKTFSPGKEDPR